MSGPFDPAFPGPRSHVSRVIDAWNEPDDATANGGNDPDRQAGGPVLVGANWYRFRASEQIRHDLVVSLCFVWVVQGTGTIRTGDQEFRMDGSSILRLPWRHSVEYLPDARAPFSVGTIHLVPWHAHGVPVALRPSFVPGDPLADVDYRRSTGAMEIVGPMARRSRSARNIVTLGTYAIERFLAEPVSESTCRALGTLVMEEDALWHATQPGALVSPVALEQMTEFVLANLDGHLSVAQIAAVGNCSPVTAERLFTRYTGLSVLAWVRTRRMERAATLLRTTSLRANEVARLVGFADPLYFSRVFRATFSVPPSQYALNQLRP